MADEPKYTREIRDGVEVLVYPSGQIKRADNGQNIRPPDKAIIRTPERAKELAQIKKEKGVLAELRAMAKAQGKELLDDATIEEIIEQAADTHEAQYLHLHQEYMRSQNIRGMSEAYTKLAAPLVGERGEPAQVNNTVNMFQMSEEAMRFIEEVKKRLTADPPPQIIDAQTDAWQDLSHGPKE
jgi:hypothetical protein